MQKEHEGRYHGHDAPPHNGGDGIGVPQHHHQRSKKVDKEAIKFETSNSWEELEVQTTALGRFIGIHTGTMRKIWRKMHSVN
jgi:hypothetical protein